MMFKFVRPIVSGVALAAAFSVAPASAEMLKYAAELTAASEVPPNDSKGTGKIEATYDTTTKKLTWSGEYADLTGPEIAAHFHGPVSYLGLTAEENAPIQVGTPGDLTSPFHGIAQISADQAKDLKDGRWYFNVHSKKFPAGEIRGPVIRK